MRKPVAILLVALAGVTFAGAAPASAQTPDQRVCTNKDSAPDASIAACSRIISAGRFKGADLAKIYAWRAMAYQKKNDHDRTVADLSVAVRLDPKYADGYQLRSSAYLRRNDYDRAIADASETIRLNPRHASAYVNRGLGYIRKGELALAIADLSQAITFNPTYALAHGWRAEANFSLKKFQEAIEGFDEAIRLDPKIAWFHNLRGASNRELGRLDDALRDHDQAIRIDPAFAAALANRGVIFARKGEHERAFADFSAAISNGLKEARHYAWRAEANYNLKKFQDAIRDFDEAIRLDPRMAWFHNLRGAANRELGRLQDAIRDHDEAIRLDPKFAVAYANRGVAHRRLNDVTRAIRDFDEAIRLNPKDARYYLHRSGAHKANGNLGQAYRDVVEAIALNPSYTEATREREAIRSLMAAAESKAVAAVTPPPAPSPSPRPVVAATPSGPRVALVIGNGKYRAMAELPNPANDARDIADALRELGFRVIEGYDLDSAGMRAKIAEFGAAMPGAGTTLFFYAGHGIQVGGQNYLVPTDAKFERPSALDVEAVRVSTILSDMEAEKRVNLVFLDACRDNPLSRSLAQAFGATRSAAIGQGLAQVNAGIGTLITFATSPDRTALDGTGRNSPFTAALLKHIRTPDIEIRTLLTRVRADVIRETNERQIPWDHSSLTGEFYFKRGG